MSDSNPGLLDRLRKTDDQGNWARLVDLYSAHLFLWACRAGLQGPDAAELVRQVFAAVHEQFGSYRGDSPGAFRQWLRGLAHAQRRAFLQRLAVPAGKAAPAAVESAPVPAAADALWEAEYLPSLLRAAVEVVRPDLEPAVWKAWWRLSVEGRPAAEVARELGLTVATVYAAEARVLGRLRRELAGLLD